LNAATLTVITCPVAGQDDDTGTALKISYQGGIWADYAATAGTFGNLVKGGNTENIVIPTSGWNFDILIAAFNQEADGTNGVCPQFFTALASSNDDTITLKTAMSSKEKCTFQLESIAGKGVGLVNKTMGFATYQFHWIEFAADSLTAAGAEIGVSTSPIFLGKAIAAGKALNPITGSTNTETSNLG